MATAKKKKAPVKSSGRKKKKGGRPLRRALLLIALLLVVAGIGWFFRDAFGAFGDRVKDRLSETKRKLPKVSITPASAAPETGGAATAAASASSSAAAVQEQLIGRIVEVMDGDTLTAVSGDRTFKIRLYGIDAPEVLQDYGPVARDILRDKVLDGEAEFGVVTVRDGLYFCRVRYDGRDINYEMVRDGCAWYDRRNAPGETALENAENTARRAKQGIWSVKSPTPPWVFRSRNR